MVHLGVVHCIVDGGLDVAARECPLDRVEELSRFGHGGNHRRVRQHAEIIEREHIVGVCHGDHDTPAALRDRQRLVSTGDLLGNATRHDQVESTQREVDEVVAESLRQDACEVHRRDRAHLHERLSDAPPGFPLQSERVREVFGADETALGQHLADTGETLPLR